MAEASYQNVNSLPAGASVDLFLVKGYSKVLTLCLSSCSMTKCQLIVKDSNHNYRTIVVVYNSSTSLTMEVSLNFQVPENSDLIATVSNLGIVATDVHVSCMFEDPYVEYSRGFDSSLESKLDKV